MFFSNPDLFLKLKNNIASTSEILVLLLFLEIMAAFETKNSNR